MYIHTRCKWIEICKPNAFNFRWLHIPLATVNISTWIQHTYEQNKQVNPTAGTQSEGNEPCHDEAALFFSRWISRWEANGYRITHLIYTHFSLQSFTLSLSPSTFISLSLVCCALAVWFRPANPTRPKSCQTQRRRYLHYKKALTSSIYCLVVTVDNFHICHDPRSNKWPIPIPATPLPLSRHALGEICMSVCFISPAVKMLSPFIFKCFGFFFKRQFVCSRLVWYLVFDELHPNFFLKLVPHLWICGDHASKCLLCAFYYVWDFEMKMEIPTRLTPSSVRL